MPEFFKVGESYENRLGTYEVTERKTPLLVIRYHETGRLQEVEEELQERIVRNLMRERELALRPAEERRPATKAARPRRKRAKFEGFAHADFEGKIAGTSWRAKTGLGGVIAEALTDTSGEPFDSWAPNRQTAVYITNPDECGAQFLADSAQFFILTSEVGLSYGLSIQRPAEAAEGATAWDRLLSTLTDDEEVSARLSDLLTDGTVELSWYGQTWGMSERETVRGAEDGLISDRGAVVESDTFEDIIERLNEAPQDENLILTIDSSMSQDDAVKAGASIADTVVALFEALIFLYRACTA